MFFKENMSIGLVKMFSPVGGEPACLKTGCSPCIIRLTASSIPGDDIGEASPIFTSAIPPAGADCFNVSTIEKVG